MSKIGVSPNLDLISTKKFTTKKFTDSNSQFFKTNYTINVNYVQDRQKDNLFGFKNTPKIRCPMVFCPKKFKCLHSHKLVKLEQSKS